MFGMYEKLFRDSATKMMLSSLIILISISISIGLPARPLNIVDEIQNLNCSLTNRYFLEKLKLNETCADSYVADDSRIGETTSMSLDLCMAYLELNKDFCKMDTSSTHYRSGLYDERTIFVIHNITQYNTTQVDGFLQGLNKRVKDSESFYKYLNNSRKQLEPYKWTAKFFGRMSTKSDSEMLCGFSKDVKDFCSFLLWARTLKVEQIAIENNNSNIDNKQQSSSTESLKSPSRTAEEEMTLNESANHIAAAEAAAPAHSKVLAQPPSANGRSSTVGSPVPPSSADDDNKNNADTAKKLSSTVSNSNRDGGDNDNGKINVGDNGKYMEGDNGKYMEGNNGNGNMEGNDNGNEDGNNGNVNENRGEPVKDNRYESVVVVEGRADELKSNADKEAKKEEEGGKGEVKVAAGFEENEPLPAKEREGEGGVGEGEVEPQQQSHVMSIKDRVEEGGGGVAAAANGQFDSNFNEQQQLLTVAEDKQGAAVAANAADDQANNNNDEFADPADEDPDDLDVGAPQESPAKQGSAAVRISNGVEQMPVIARGNMDPIGSDESHFYSYFISMGAIVVLLYLMLHYKKKLLALAVEGRRGRSHGSGRRRPNTASYSKLDSNLEEAMASNMSQHASVTHVLY